MGKKKKKPKKRKQKHNSSSFSIVKNKPQKNHTIIEQQKFFAGPIPSPEVMQEYKDIDPGLPDRIMTMAEKQQAHRTAMERREQKIYPFLLVFGQLLGFFLGIVALLGGFYLISINKDAQGIATLVGSVATLIGIYIYNKKQPPTP